MTESGAMLAKARRRGGTLALSERWARRADAIGGAVDRADVEAIGLAVDRTTALAAFEAMVCGEQKHRAHTADVSRAAAPTAPSAVGPRATSSWIDRARLGQCSQCTRKGDADHCESLNAAILAAMRSLRCSFDRRRSLRASDTIAEQQEDAPALRGRRLEARNVRLGVLLLGDRRVLADGLVGLGVDLRSQREPADGLAHLLDVLGANVVLKVAREDLLEPARSDASCAARARTSRRPPPRATPCTG